MVGDLFARFLLFLLIDVPGEVLSRLSQWWDERSRAGPPRGEVASLWDRDLDP